MKPQVAALVISTAVLGGCGRQQNSGALLENELARRVAQPLNDRLTQRLANDYRAIIALAPTLKHQDSMAGALITFLHVGPKEGVIDAGLEICKRPLDFYYEPLDTAVADFLNEFSSGQLSELQKEMMVQACKKRVMISRSDFARASYLRAWSNLDPKGLRRELAEYLRKQHDNRLDTSFLYGMQSKDKDEDVEALFTRYVGTERPRKRQWQ